MTCDGNVFLPCTSLLSKVKADFVISLIDDESISSCSLNINGNLYPFTKIHAPNSTSGPWFNYVQDSSTTSNLGWAWGSDIINEIDSNKNSLFYGNVGIGVVNPTKKLEVNGDIECNTLYGQISKNNYAGPNDSKRGWSLPYSSGTGSSCAVWHTAWESISGHYSNHNQFIRHFIKNFFSSYSANSLSTRVGWEAYDTGNSGGASLDDAPGDWTQQAYLSLIHI